MEIPEIIKKIIHHKLGEQDEAFSLYNEFCNSLKEKYGCVDQDYDCNPTKRGKEWIDIHHILEYKLDDIAKRTKRAKHIQRECSISTEDQTSPAAKPSSYNLDYSLEDLKPYNIKEQLVYANKIEHFLLHYLIVSIRNTTSFSGGPNYLWDACVALDLYNFKRDYMNKIQTEKEKYYSQLSSLEITLLYKNLIDWKGWSPKQCIPYWINLNNIIKYLYNEKVSYVKYPEKFFLLLGLLGIKPSLELKLKFLSLPYDEKSLNFCKKGAPAKLINGDYYSLDEKTILLVQKDLLLKTFFIPKSVEKISKTTFLLGYSLEELTIPETVKEIEDAALAPKLLPKLKTIIFKGTKETWDINFPNIELGNVKIKFEKTL